MSDEPVFDIRDLAVSYDGRLALRDVTFQVEQNEVTAIIGPSGCGKSTFIRCLNRMNDVVPGAKVEGTILYNGLDLYGRGVDPVEVRQADRNGLPAARTRSRSRSTTTSRTGRAR